jgi:protein phosphatase
MQCRLPPTASFVEVRRTIHNGLVRGQEEIVARMFEHHRCRGGATVVVAVWLHDKTLHLAHLGDSRAYLIRGDCCSQLTTDHTVANALIEVGTITPESALPWSGVLCRYLGAANRPEPDFRTLEIQPGDRFLLCTDGLSNVVSEERLLRCIAEERDAQKCADALGQLALGLGGRDNVSCVLLEFATTPGGDVATSAARIDMPKRWPGSITALATALTAGEDCTFALYDALEESGHHLLARHFRMGQHPRDCWALQLILGK